MAELNSSKIYGDLSVTRELNAKTIKEDGTLIREHYQPKVIPCSTAVEESTATPLKAISIPGYSLKVGDILAVTFTNGNTAVAPALSINGGSGIPIMLAGGVPTSVSASGAAYAVAGGTMLLYYDGSAFNLFGSQDITDANTTSIINLYDGLVGAYKISPASISTSGRIYYPFIGFCADGTIDKITDTANTTSASTRIFTGQPICYNMPILHPYASSTAYVAGGTLNTPSFSRREVGTSVWKYAIGQYYNKSGVLTGNNITTDLVSTPLYLGGSQNGDYFSPSEFSLTFRTDQHIYKRIGYFTTQGYFYLSEIQPCYFYDWNSGQWREFANHALSSSYSDVANHASSAGFATFDSQANDIAATYATKTALQDYIPRTDIVNNSTDGGKTKPLSAEQGKYLKGLIDGKEIGRAFSDIRSLVEHLNDESSPEFPVGFNLFIVDIDFPDFWVSEVEAESLDPAYYIEGSDWTEQKFVDDVDAAMATSGAKGLRVGWYSIGRSELAKVDLQNYVQQGEAVPLDSATSEAVIAGSALSSPTLVLQRGTLVDAYHDWRMRNEGGNYYIQTKQGSDWLDRLAFNYNNTLSISGITSSTISGTLNTGGNLSESGQRVYSPNNKPTLASDTTGTLSIARGGTGNTTGLAASATKLATARKLKVDLSSRGDSSLFNGTQDIEAIPTTGSLETTYLTEPDSIANNISLTAQSNFDVLRADRTAFLPADQIIIEQSTNAGVTWTDAGISDYYKKTLFSGARHQINIPLKNGVKSTDCMLRVTITAMKYNVPSGTPETSKYNYWGSSSVLSAERYCSLDTAWLWVSAVNDRIHMQVQRATGASPNSWIAAGTGLMSGWSGGNFVKLPGIHFGGYTGSTSNSWNYRFIFRTCSAAGTFNDADLSTSSASTAQNIFHIKTTGKNFWTPSNSLMKHDHLYDWDENQNALFPAAVKMTELRRGNYTYALPSKNGTMALTSDILIDAVAKAGDTMTGTLIAPQFDGKLIGKNTRFDDSPPTFYVGGIAGQTNEFKEIDTLGNLSTYMSGAFCTLITYNHWTDLSGGHPTQIALGTATTVICFRQATGPTTWGEWIRVYTTSYRPTAEQINAADRVHTHTEFLTSATSGTPTVTGTKTTTPITFKNASGGTIATVDVETQNGSTISSSMTTVVIGNAGRPWVSDGSGGYYITIPKATHGRGDTQNMTINSVSTTSGIDKRVELDYEISAAYTVTIRSMVDFLGKVHFTS